MDLSLIFPFIIVLLFIPIFLSGRKQKRLMAEMQALQASLEAGDVVMTTSGLRATVVDASYEDTIDLEIADGIVTTWVRAAVKEKVDLSAHNADHDHGHDYTADDAADPTDAPHEPSPSLEKAPSVDDTGNGTARS
jgi:preprotein translocase subunit YajC